MPEPSDRCQTCRNTYAWHEENNPVHPFNDGQAGAKAFLGSRRVRDPQTGRKVAQQGSQTPPTVVWPSDPVLRVALMNAGVITADDLRRAEEQLRAAMGPIFEGGPNGQQAEGTRGREVQVGETAPMDVG